MVGSDLRQDREEGRHPYLLGGLGQDVADIATRHTIRIHSIRDGDPSITEEFDRFLTGLRANLNDSITPDDAISMLSQHLITRPIFEALFGTDSFAMNNPVSRAMQAMVDILDQHNLDTETENLDKFYDSVRRRVEGIPLHDAEARQRIIKDLGRVRRTTTSDRTVTTRSADSPRDSANQCRSARSDDKGKARSGVESRQSPRSANCRILPYKEEVGGSSPSTPTIGNPQLRGCFPRSQQ